MMSDYFGSDLTPCLTSGEEEEEVICLCQEDSDLTDEKEHRADHGSGNEGDVLLRDDEEDDMVIPVITSVVSVAESSSLVISTNPSPMNLDEEKAGGGSSRVIPTRANGSGPASSSTLSAEVRPHTCIKCNGNYKSRVTPLHHAVHFAKHHSCPTPPPRQLYKCHCGIEFTQQRLLHRHQGPSKRCRDKKREMEVQGRK